MVILRGQNIELRIVFPGSTYPASIRVYIRYLKEDSDDKVSAISPGMYTNTTDILTAYIPNAITPHFTRFKVRIALGTDNDHVGPYIAPTKDIVYGKCEYISMI